MKMPTVWNAGEKVFYMDAFDEMVDDLRNGETIEAEFDTGIRIRINYETLEIEDDDALITISSEELLDYIRLFLETRFVAREIPLDINYDGLLNGI